MVNPLFKRFDGMGGFLDSRDGGLNAMQDSIAKYTNGEAMSHNGRAPVGSVVDVERMGVMSGNVNAEMSEDEKRRIPYASFNPGIYADMTQLLVPLVNGVDSLVLARPRNTRVMLIIQNPFAANLYMAFDQQANVGSLIVPPLGNLLFDTAVPQNDIHLFYAGANVNVPVFYMDADITRSTT